MQKLIANIKSWHTTVMGIIAGLLVALPQAQYLLDGNPETVFSWEALATGLGIMGIGLFAKDGDKTSEDAGLK